jgi:hypothetical protein
MSEDYNGYKIEVFGGKGGRVEVTGGGGEVQVFRHLHNAREWIDANPVAPPEPEEPEPEHRRRRK